MTTLVTGTPFLIVHGIKLVRKQMFITHAKAERDTGYTARPVEEALFDAIPRFKSLCALSKAVSRPPTEPPFRRLDHDV